MMSDRDLIREYIASHGVTKIERGQRTLPLDAPASLGGVMADQRRRASALAQRWEALRTRYRDMILAGLDVDHIAAEMGVSRAAVRKRANALGLGKRLVGIDQAKRAGGLGEPYKSRARRRRITAAEWHELRARGKRGLFKRKRKCGRGSTAWAYYRDMTR